MIVQRFNLNLIPNQSPVIVHVNQYDTGTGRLVATLYEGNEPYSPSGTAVIQGTKPDGHGFQYTATLDGNVVTADLTEQMAPVAGDVRAQIVVTESSGATGTFVFIMRVQPSALPSDADMSESDYPLIEEAIREAQEAVIDSHDNAENSEAWAQGTRGGIPVEPTDPTYEHNAEYWAHQAEGAASGVSSFNGRSGSILPMAGDYDSEKILLSSALHIGGETQNDVQKALEALEGNKADRVDNAVADNFAGLDADGNLKDSGKNAGNFATPSDIEQIYADNGVLGAKNLLTYRYANTTKTENGITFTDNGDGTVTIGAGTATGNAFFAFANASKNIKIGKGQYVISGGVSNSIAFYFQLSSGDVVDTGNGAHFSLDSDYTFVPGKATYIRVLSGTVISSPVTIKPMLRLASDPDDTYQPYAMTNRELTNGKADKTDLTSIIATGSTNSTGATITSGTYFYLNGTLVRAKANIANGATYTLNTNYEEMTEGVLNNQAKSWIVVFYYGTQTGVPNYTRNNNILLKVGHLVFMSCNFNITSRGNGTSPRISTKSYKLPYKPNATAVGTFANSIKTLNMVAEKDNDEYFILKNLDGTDATVTDMAVGDVTLTIVYTTDE